MMNKKTICLILLPFSILAACQVIPDIEKPENSIEPVVTYTKAQSITTSDPDVNPTNQMVNSIYEQAPCHIASAGTPFDITIPDGSTQKPGGAFTKVWRLQNSGSCTWTKQYAVVIFSGVNLSMNNSHYLESEVKPGEIIDIEIEMFAPVKPGVYQSFWILQSPDGDLFGVGPKGRAPFWVRINVVDTRTSTPSPIPSVTPVTDVLISGSVQLLANESLDLDSGKVNTTKYDDIWLKHGENSNLQLEIMGKCVWVLFGQRSPSIDECHSQLFNQDSLIIKDDAASQYVCYITGQGLPGYFRINPVINQNSLNIDYLTWEIP